MQMSLAILTVLYFIGSCLPLTNGINGTDSLGDSGGTPGLCINNRLTKSWCNV